MGRGIAEAIPSGIAAIAEPKRAKIRVESCMLSGITVDLKKTIEKCNVRGQPRVMKF